MIKFFSSIVLAILLTGSLAAQKPIFDQMDFKDSVKPRELTDVGLTTGTRNVTEYWLNHPNPIDQPNRKQILAYTGRWAHCSHVILDIETLRATLRKQNPQATEPELDAEEREIRETYYRIAKEAAPHSMIIQYNVQSAEPGLNDAIWLSRYIGPRQTAEEFLAWVDDAIAKCKPNGRPVYFNTGPVQFATAGNGLRNDRPVPPAVFAGVIKGLLERDTIDGISLWYQKNPDRPGTLPVESFEQHYEILRRAVIIQKLHAARPKQAVDPDP